MNINILRNQLLKDLKRFYTPSNFSQIYPILIGEDALSMTIINFTVITYAEDFASYITIDDKRIYIRESYNRQLEEYNKKCFDPFCREPKIYFQYDEKNDKSIITSVAQLNFYRWAIEIKLLKFIRDNYDSISHHMHLKAKATKSELSALSASSASERAKNKARIVKSIDTKFIDTL